MQMAVAVARSQVALSCPGPIEGIALSAVRLQLQRCRAPRLGTRWLIWSQLLQLCCQIPDLHVQVTRMNTEPALLQ